MDIKMFMASFMLTSILFFLLYIPTRLTIPTIKFNPMTSLNIVQKSNLTYPVRFAYLISGAKGDTMRLKRSLRSIYHPGNQYLIHMDVAAPLREHREIQDFVANDPVFRLVGNVYLVEKPNMVTYTGSTMLANTLHAMAILLKCCEWDWFINLSASDYPLITQDDLIDAFSGLSKDLNFIQHTSNLGWKLSKRGRPVMIDPGLYSYNKSQVWWITQQRGLPTTFKLYTGSAWTIISRSLAEYTTLGYENFPRTLLLYYANFVSSPEGYFQTLICNTKDYKNTTVNHDLHYITWDNPPKQHPRALGLRDYRRMVLSGRPFARKFKKNDPVLDKIDKELLRRRDDTFAFGGWCSGNGEIQLECSDFHGDKYGVLEPGVGSKRLKALLTKIFAPSFLKKRQCTPVEELPHV